MLKKNAITNFSSGEIDPELHGRVDLPIFSSSVFYDQNFIPHPKGAAKHRYGGLFVGSGRGNIIPYTYSDEFSYALILRSAVFNVAKDGALIFDESKTKTIASVTKANPCVVTATSHGYSNDQEIYIYNNTGMEEILGGPFIVKSATTHTFQLYTVYGVAVNSTNFSTYTSGGQCFRPVEVATPWTDDMAAEVRYVQVDDELLVVQRGAAPRKITRGANHYTWTLASYAPTGTPFTSTDNYPGAIASYENRVVLASTNNDPMKIWFTKAGDINVLTAGVGDTDAFDRTVASTSSEFIYDIRAMEDFLAFSSSVQIYKGTSSGPVITATDVSISPYIIGVGGSPVMMVTTDVRAIFVQSGRKKIRSFTSRSQQEVPIPDHLNFPVSHFADKSSLKRLTFQEGDPNILWCTHDDNTVTAMTIDDNEKIIGWFRFRFASDMQIYSMGVTRNADGHEDLWMNVGYDADNSIWYTVFFSAPPVIPRREDYYTDEDSEDDDVEDFLYDMYEAQKTLGYLDIWGAYDGTEFGTDASAAITPAAITGNTTISASASVFLTTDVGKEIRVKGGPGIAEITARNSATSVNVTVVEDFADTSAIAAGSWYLTTDEISGIRHLEGDTIQVVADGMRHEDVTVTNGQITLDGQYSYVVFGLKYKGVLISNELNQNAGEILSEPKTVYKVDVDFYNTAGGKIGTSLYDLQEIEFRAENDVVGRPTPLFTGDKQIDMQDAQELKKRIVVVQDEPFPCTVLAMKAHYQVGSK